MQPPATRAVAFLGVPYRLHGRTPEGWDCWGCVAYLRGELFGKPTRSWAEAYRPEDAADWRSVERLIAAGLHEWREVEARPGAVALLMLHGRPIHVGLMLDRREMIHAIGGGETVIEPVDRRWPAPARRKGFFDAD